MTYKPELVSNFGPEADNPDVIAILENYMKLYALTADDLYIKWEQFSYHYKEAVNSLDKTSLDNFKVFIQQQTEKHATSSYAGSNPTNGNGSLMATGSSATKKPRVPRQNGSPSLFGFGGSPKTPMLKKRRLEPTPSKLSDEAGLNNTSSSKTGLYTPNGTLIDKAAQIPTPLRGNIEADKTLHSINTELPVAEGIDMDSEQKVRLAPFYDAKKYKYRTMRQSLLDSAEVLDEQINFFTDIVQEHFKLSNSDIGDPTIQSQSSVTCVGRIVPENPSDERINMESVAIETSRSVGIGRRVKLDLTDVNECSLFPGQIVAMRGKNANGEYFKVEELLELPHLNSPVSTLQEIQEAHVAMENKHTKVIVTCGPYTARNALDFSNLTEFVARVNSTIKPHVLVMFGPFLDITHPLIETGQVPNFPNLKVQPRTLDEIFMKVISPILKSINPNIQVVMIPSTKDALSRHVSYPQDSFSRRDLQLPKNFKCYTNPATFRLNEFFMGCSNIDTFKDIKEIAKGTKTLSKNRFDRVSEHILQQRRFYPCIPGSISTRKSASGDDREHISGADLELPYLGLTEFVGDFIPDIMIIPSDLVHFVRVVKNVLMINPGIFIRAGGSRGTYAQLSIAPPDLEVGCLTKVTGNEDVYLHNIWKRARVDILSA
ncbi:HBL174Wp [Eremothecium sinecaudum]|uniref:DNA polymerase alpha subunit B n=1 Tax=Eremothecium sinecaudum TaxID=45286 RepID=A0A109UWE3_9SACH|nr:HBL174Wp [Eremothecium sinecaudum]AMD18728.1 HBL174Wp [Eremothecium sinecaudum]